jgi:hypothetical protein
MPSRVGDVALALCLFAAPEVAAAQESRSAPLAHELTALMAALGLRSVAAEEPDTAGRFVVALVFPKVQLLVMSARHPSPSLLRDALRKRRYDETQALSPKAYAAKFRAADELYARLLLVLITELKAQPST